MSALSDAFNAMLDLISRDVMISRPGHATYNTPRAITIHPSNFFSQAQSVSETTIEGHEFIIRKTALTAANYPTPQRGDKLTDTELGLLRIEQIWPIYDLGGSIMGFRLRTG